MKLPKRKRTSIYDEPINKVLEGMRTYGVEDPEFDKLLPACRY